jgi:hypothetical protein
MNTAIVLANSQTAIAQAVTYSADRNPALVYLASLSPRILLVRNERCHMCLLSVLSCVTNMIHDNHMILTNLNQR